MSSTERPSLLLVRDTIRTHRWGIVAWILGSVVAMVAEAAAIARELDRFPGGPQALAASMRPSVEALRLMRWPAERLDTLGGYLTYHNVILFMLGLAIYATVQGASAARGAEAGGVGAQILAAGRPRASLILDRALGFALTLTLICLGLGASLAMAMAAGGEPDLRGSFVTAFATGLGAFIAYGLGAVISQLMPTARAGTGVAVLVVTALYLLTNMWERLGPLGAVRFFSLFYYVDFSRALVPGYGLDVPSCLGMAVAGVGLVVVAAWVFERRDYAAGLWRPRPRASRPVRRVQRPALGSLWSATLVRQRAGLAAWAASTAVVLAVLAWLEPNFAELWDELAITQTVIAGMSTRTVADQYLAFAGQIVVPIVAAYVITQAAGWVSDLRQGRVELILAGPVSWPQLVWQRLVAALVGVAVITGAGIAGLAGAAVAVGADLDALGLLRLAVDTLLLAAAVAAVAALMVAWLRSGAAVTVLAVFIAGSYLLVYLVPSFDWPEWLSRASVFGAFGNPYLEIPAWTGLTVLSTMAVIGGLAAAAVAQRSPKVAT